VLIPTSVFQLAAVLLLAVPGIVYTAARRRLVGPTPEDQAFSVRLTRALAVSVVLDLVYVLALSPWIVRPAEQRRTGEDILNWIATRPATSAGVALLLLVVIPTAVALIGQLRLRRPFRLRRPVSLAPIYHPTPSAWDRAAPDRGRAFVRIFTEDGHWVGGWLGPASYLSTYPQPRDIFIDVEWTLSKTGDFLTPVPDSLGVYVPLTGKERVAWIATPPQDDSTNDSAAPRPGTPVANQPDAAETPPGSPPRTTSGPTTPVPATEEQTPAESPSSPPSPARNHPQAP
jgi:Family of unknown function (DUF6338)